MASASRLGLGPWALGFGLWAVSFGLWAPPARSEVFGCVDAEQGQAAGQHRPGGFGERQPGPVGGRGFLVAARQHRVLEGEQGVGDDDQVPGETIGSAVRGRSGEGGGVFGEGGDEGVGMSGVAMGVVVVMGVVAAFRIPGVRAVCWMPGVSAVC